MTKSVLTYSLRFLIGFLAKTNGSNGNLTYLDIQGMCYDGNRWPKRTSDKIGQEMSLLDFRWDQIHFTDALKKHTIFSLTPYIFL